LLSSFISEYPSILDIKKVDEQTKYTDFGIDPEVGKMDDGLKGNEMCGVFEIEYPIETLITTLRTAELND
jgi:hypothetical protein